MTAVPKLAIGGAIVFGVTTYMAWVGASTSWKYYLTTDECIAGTATLMGQRVRVGGYVEPDSLQIAPGRERASFSLTGSRGSLHVICSGPLPDNLAEGVDVVVDGRLDTNGFLRGNKVLTRCASKYESAYTTASSAHAPARDAEEAR